MKKILITLVFVMMTIMSFSQVNFMESKVDGTPGVMASILKDKGFYDTGETFENEGHKRQILKGNFNGTTVHLFVVSNHGKVFRIYLAEVTTHNEAEIISRFNNLFDQFYNNKKYILIDGKKIPQNEDISYEMSCHNKLYDAYFYQILSDDMTEDNTVWFRIARYYSEYYITIYYDNLLNYPNGEDL